MQPDAGEAGPRYNLRMPRLGIAALLALSGFLIALALRAFGTTDRLELLTLDARHTLGLGRAAPGPEIVVAWIDQESMDYMDQNDVPFPWPREVYGQVLDHLRAAGAKAVVFDVLFDQRGNAEDDRSFATALAQGPGDALAMKFVSYRHGGRDAAETAALAARGLSLAAGRLQRPREAGAVLPLPEFAVGADRLGFVNIRADGDGTYRRYDLLRSWGPPDGESKLQPSLALAALLAAYPDGQLAWGPEGALQLPNGRTVHCPDDARVLLNLRGKAFTFAPVKFVNILESINREAEGQPPLYPAARFRDKIVLVGIHAEGLEDAHPTPLDAQLPGVELHATALDNLLHADPLRVPAIELPLMAAVATLATATVFALPGVVMPALVLLGLLLAGLIGTLWAWTALLAVPIAAPAVAGGAAAGASFLWRLVVEGKQKREMHRAFRSYLAPEVLAEVLRNPGDLHLGGTTRDVTLFFTDLQGFTNLAEKSEPQQLVGFLNDYFTRMCEPVLAQRGIIDKFIGDAIMAIFGAPAETPAHGRAAVVAAVQALAVSERIAAELQQRGLPPIATRIGIHRGQAVVGNMGSASRFDYTAIGDTVNLAARLEGANKAFGTRCLCSETAWADVGDLVVGREVGRVTVVGRSEPIRVFEPLALRASAKSTELALAERWQQAMAAWTAGDRAASRELFTACQLLRPDDKLCKRWREGLEEPAFTGVFSLDSK
jgi:adenylate cyclase